MLLCFPHSLNWHWLYLLHTRITRVCPIKKNTVSSTVWMTWNLVHETSIAMFGAQIKHTIWNSSQSYPISVKLEKKLFHHFIVSEMWISNETKKMQKKNKSEQNGMSSRRNLNILWTFYVRKISWITLWWNDVVFFGANFFVHWISSVAMTEISQLLCKQFIYFELYLHTTLSWNLCKTLGHSGWIE